MGRAARLLLTSLLLLVGSCNNPDEGATGPAAADVRIEPRIVLQVGHNSPIADVAWVNGGRNLVSLDDSGLLVIWDVENALIVDHAQVPISDSMYFHAMEPQVDSDKLTLVFFHILSDDPYADEPEVLPAEVQSYCQNDPTPEPPTPDPGGNELWCSFTFDPATRRVEPLRLSSIPDEDPELPQSPDGIWAPQTIWAVVRDAPPQAEDRTDFEWEDAANSDRFPCDLEQRCEYGIALQPTDGDVVPVRLIGQERTYATSLEISSDGKQLVQLDLIDFTRTKLRTFDLVTQATGQPMESDFAYTTASWIDDRRFAIFRNESAGAGFETDRGQGYEGVVPMSICRWFANDELTSCLDGLENQYGALDQRAFAPARIINPECAQGDNCPTVPAYYQMQLLNEEGDFIGAGNLADCEVDMGALACERDTGEGEASPEEPNFGAMSDGISRYDAANATWTRMAQPDWGNEEIWALRLSPAKDRLAVLTRETDLTREAWDILRLRIFSIAGNRLVADGPVLFEKSYVLGSDYGSITSNGGNEVDPEGLLRFTPDGSHVMFSHFMRRDLVYLETAYELVVAKTDGSEPARRFQNHSRTIVPLDSRRVLEVESGRITDLETGEALATLSNMPALMSAGWIEASRLIWGASDDGRIQFWDADSGSLELTTYLLPGDQFFTMMPDGRYDSNFGPDTSAVRWVVPDQPWDSLAPQTFMRDFYEPGLYGKLLDCRANDNCAFRPIPEFDRINRMLPDVEIVDISPAADPANVIVTVEATEGRGRDGESASGIYNLRLFRNDRLVAMTPNAPDRIPKGTEDWRVTINRWRGDNDLHSDGVVRQRFTVPLPTGEGSERQVFSAYAFNEDRIKSETASFVLERPLVPRTRMPKAYVITVGIDDYDVEAMRLNYAVADAQLLGSQLSAIPGYEVVHVALTAELGRPGSRLRGVTRETMLATLRLLSPGEESDDIRAQLRAAGVDASLLMPTTPDDLVIVSFSGHGWTDRLGNFFLVPSDGRTTGLTSDAAHLVSAADLSDALRLNQAGEIALIVDACFSAAIVENSSFRPGPMGDSGLGQLAYDKGILILAAAQADNYAIEASRLSHGLLTYALAGPDEGLSLPGNADADNDLRITLNEWLTFALDRLPTLSADRTIGRYDARSGTLQPLGRAASEAGYIQRPSLFNFNSVPSPVTMRQSRPASAASGR